MPKRRFFVKSLVAVFCLLTVIATSTPSALPAAGTMVIDLEYQRPEIALKYDEDKNEIVEVYVNNQEVQFDQPAIVKNGRTLVPMRKIFELLGADVEWDNATQTVTAKKKDKVITLIIGNNTAKADGTDVVLEQAPILKNDRTLVPLRFMSEALNAVVYWDDYNRRAAVSEYNSITQNDVFSVKDGKFQLNGKDFAEISFNMFDLFWCLYDERVKGNTLDENNPVVKKYDQNLKDMRDNGFKTIRIFGIPYFTHEFYRTVYVNEQKRQDVFYSAVEKAFDLCDKYDIRVVYSIGVTSFNDRFIENGAWALGEDHLRELVGDPESKAKQRLNGYIDDLVTRYRDRKTIAMWELANETTNNADIAPSTAIYDDQRMPRLNQMAYFWDDCARRIKTADPIRMVNSGGSHLRESAWNQYTKGTWTPDTWDQHMLAYQFYYEKTAVDIIDFHDYKIPVGGYVIKQNNGITDLPLTMESHMEAARLIGKPLMIGEFGALPEAKGTGNWKMVEWFEKIEDPASEKWVQAALDPIIESGCQLAYYWSFNNSHQQQSGVLDVSIERTPIAFRQIVDANQKLKKKLNILQ